MAIDRTNFNALVDDDGTNTIGSVWNKSAIQNVLLDPIDAVLLNTGASTKLTLASDAVTVTGHYHRIDTESNAASDNLATLTAGTGVTDGHLLVLKPENVARVVTVKDGTGNILLKGGDFAMNDAKHRLLVIKDGSSWYELARSSTASGGLLSGSNYINDTSNANMTVGLTINQGASDDEILALKSSDVGHGMTGVTETDTYARLLKASAAGGLRIDGIGPTTADGLALRGTTTSGSSTRSTAATGVVSITGAYLNGTSTGATGANQNLLVIGDNGTTRFIFDSDGDSHQDVGTAWTNFDTEDDVALLHLLAAHVSQITDPLRAGFGAWLEHHRTPLERLRLVTFNDDGHHFVNMSRLTMLLVGAARQQDSRVTRLEARLLALEAGRG